MNKKALYAVIAVVVVIIMIVAVLEVLVLPSSAATMTVSTSTSSTSVGQTVNYYAFISGGTPSKVVFNFGDGATGTATHLSGNEYTVTHSYTSAGKYLVTANASVNGKYINNLNSIDEVTVMPATVSPTLASELTESSIITSTQIYSNGSTISLTASTLQPPSATNWTIGYYIWSFGDGSTQTSYTVFNTTSGSFMAENISHVYSTAGIYAVTLGVITFNAMNYVPANYTSNGTVYEYYPVSDLTSILSGQYYNNTYISTIIVTAAGQTAQLLKSTVTITNPNEITVTELSPGSPYSFDPAIEYESVGSEELENVYETLIAYNGSSTTSLVPVIATEIPTIANGGISANGLNYTFYIRSGLKFSNGDPVTAWDAYTTFVRTMLFMLGTPGTAGWIISQDLLPDGGYAPEAISYQNITSAISVDNTTQTVTFHLLKQDSAFLVYLTAYGAWITDYSWLVAHGAGITFTPAGFTAYMAYGDEMNYNNYVRYNAMGSGPYMVKAYIIGESILLAPNPDYAPIPGVLGYNHTVNNTVYIQWEKDPATALLMGESGLTDIVEGLPNTDYSIMSHLAAEGKISITTFPTLSIWTYTFTWNVNVSFMQSTFGSQYHMPFDYFANPLVRKAFDYCFNETNFINNILGNSRYGADFGFSFTGVIPYGMAGYIQPNKLYNVPTYNLTLAKQFMMESKMYNVSVNIPIIITDGEDLQYAAAGMWAQSLTAMDPNIQASPIYVAWEEMYGFQVPGANTMPIYTFMWAPDYPYASDYVHNLLYQSGWIGYGNSWNATNLLQWGYTNESYQLQNMTNLINNASQQTNGTMALKYYDEAELISVNLTLYNYLYQQNYMLFYSTSIRGAQYEENPMFGGMYDTLYFYLTKT